MFIYIVNTISADDLATQVANVSVKFLHHFSLNAKKIERFIIYTFNMYTVAILHPGCYDTIF